MGHLCTVCTHPQRDDIDEALLLHDEGYRRIAARSGLSATAVRHHERECLQLCFQESKELAAMLSAENLLARLKALDDRALRALDTA